MNSNYITKLAKDSLYSKKAMEMLFDKIYPIIWHFYKVRLNSTEDAEDLTQNACIKVVRNLDKFDSLKGTFLTWMYKVIQNMLYDFFRQKKIVTEDIEIEILDSAASPLDDVIFNENQKILKESIKNLGKRQKEIIEMKYFFNMKNREIAESLNIKEKTVSSLLSRSLDKLEKILNNDLTENGMVYEEN
ncbi:MAG: sigma-70 family RNA polymerase sigma factor [Spirochaetes bacterium]|nr:sigma-70 family RNA polymerase sigma factor [Spirochaetota bacterium]